MVTAKELRTTLKMTQEEVASKSGVPYAAYVAYENFYREPPVTRAIKIAMALETTVEKIKWREDE